MSMHFIVFWLTQFASDLASSMTGFAVTIWAYERTGSALALSISGLLMYLPQMVGGVLAGPLVDRLNKKAVLLLTDMGQGLCSLALFALLWTGELAIWHVYCLNFLSSLIGSLKLPATESTISVLIPKERYVRASGMQSFARGTVEALSPMLAAALLGLTGMPGIMAVDCLTLLVSAVALIAFVKIPRVQQDENRAFTLQGYWSDLKGGVAVIREARFLRTLLGFNALINLTAGMTYFSLLSPMILARSGNSATALGLVNGAIGLGGIAGGALVAILPPAKDKLKVLFLCCAASFVIGDLHFSLGRSVPVWVAAGFLSNMLIPPFSANVDYFWRTGVPIALHGRVFALKYALQCGTMPIGMLLGGALADCVFVPFMASGGGALAGLYETGPGTGMAVMFLITGIVGATVCVMGMLSRRLRDEFAKRHGSAS